MFHSEVARQYVAAEVRGLMAKRRVTASELADLTGISPAALSRKLNNKVGFTVDELLRVAAALETDVRTLLPVAVSA